MEAPSTHESGVIECEFTRSLINEADLVPTIIMTFVNNEIAGFERSDIQDLKYITLKITQHENGFKFTIDLQCYERDQDPQWIFIVTSDAGSCEEFLALYGALDMWTLLVRSDTDRMYLIDKDSNKISSVATLDKNSLSVASYAS